MDEYKTFALELAKQAGRIMRNNFTLGMKKEWKADDSVLTVTDTRINSLIVESIKKKYPEHAVLGEEESHYQQSEYVWVCDPVDGTLPFSHGVPIFTFSLALVRNGTPILAIAYDPIMERLCVAVKGGGVSINEQKIIVSTMDSIYRSVIDIETWHEHKYNLNPLKEVLILQGSKPLSLCSATYAGMLVASGEFAAVIYCGPNAWDAAALKLIIEEAGGKTSDLYGSDQRYDKEINGFIGSNGILHEELVDLIKKHSMIRA